MIDYRNRAAFRDVRVCWDALKARDARIAELAAENERLKIEIGECKLVIEQQDRDAEALFRTGAVKVELSGNTGELIDKMAEAIRGDTTSDDTPWATLSEDRKEGWRGDAERALAVVKEYLTARRPTERAVTEAIFDAILPFLHPVTDWAEVRRQIEQALPTPPVNQSEGADRGTV